MVYCEIVYAIFQNFFVINNLKNMYLSIISSFSRISRFIYILNGLICYFVLNCSEKDEIYLALKNVIYLFKVIKLY